MLKFNNNHIFTGHIKQLLSSFNLPNYRVYTLENERVHNELIKDKNSKINEDPRIISSVLVEAREYPEHMYCVNYIKDNKIQKYVDGKWITSKKTYFYNKKDLNFTRNLKIKNNIYDYYTHEYLGNYLRFQRDYNNLDLMPLYNCFSDRLCNNLMFTFKINDADGNNSTTRTITFDADDPNYKIYMIPVKLFQKYTIAIDCDAKVEMCCGFYGKYFDRRQKLSYLPADTYMVYNKLLFSAPVLFDKLTIDNISMSQVQAAEYAQNEDNLKLFIKLPANCNSSITILEGDYRNYNDDGNRFITNYATENIREDQTVEYLPGLDKREFRPISKLQLLEMNTGVSYPFADRLIEYLVGNVVTHLDELEDNVKRVQTVMEKNNIHTDYYGAWEPKMRNILYDYMTDPDKIQNVHKGSIHDILGYVDKDTESLYKYKSEDPNKTITISSVDIYPNLYRATKKER